MTLLQSGPISPEDASKAHGSAILRPVDVLIISKDYVFDKIISQIVLKQFLQVLSTESQTCVWQFQPVSTSEAAERTG